MIHKVKMDQYEVSEIWNYFIARNSKYSAVKSNKAESVLPRRAFLNAIIKYTTYPVVGDVLDMDRASLYHYRKTHEGSTRYQDYRDLHSDAVLCVNRFITGDVINEDDALLKDIQELRDEVAMLRGKLSALKEIVGKQVELFVD
jgi:hypothetical protein